MNLDTVIKLDSLKDLWSIDAYNRKIGGEPMKLEDISGQDTEGTYFVFYKTGKQYYSVRLHS